MSYIDHFDHEYVGTFASLPIYRPLEEFNPEDKLDGQFSCCEKNLVIGGGYLEHPGLVVRDLDFVTAYFISDWIDFCEDTESSLYNDKETDEWAEEVHKHLFGKDQYSIMECVHWSMRDYSDFYNSCKSGAMNVPFIETEQRNAFEPWLAKNMGELVVFSFPELITSKKLALIASKVDRYLYGNVSILPAGYPNNHLGRISEGSQVKQGHGAWNVTRKVK